MKASPPGINNAVTRVAQLGGIALLAGVASFAFGYRAGLIVAAICAVAGARHDGSHAADGRASGVRPSPALGLA